MLVSQHHAKSGFNQLHNSAVFAVLAALVVVVACARPTHHQETLKAIKHESQLLMRTHAMQSDGAVPKNRWPRVIASLEPEMVTVYSEGVDILIRPGLDGGYGYHVPKSERGPPKPQGRFSAVGQGVYWYHPY